MAKRLKSKPTLRRRQHVARGQAGHERLVEKAKQAVLQAHMNNLKIDARRMLHSRGEKDFVHRKKEFNKYKQMIDVLLDGLVVRDCQWTPSYAADVIEPAAKALSQIGSELGRNCYLQIFTQVVRSLHHEGKQLHPDQLLNIALIVRDTLLHYPELNNDTSNDALMRRICTEVGVRSELLSSSDRLYNKFVYPRLERLFDQRFDAWISTIDGVNEQQRAELRDRMHEYLKRDCQNIQSGEHLLERIQQASRAFMLQQLNEGKSADQVEINEEDVDDLVSAIITNIEHEVEQSFEANIRQPMRKHEVDSAVPVSTRALATMDNMAQSSFFAVQVFKHAQAVVDKPNAAGKFSAWHYSLFSVMAGLAIVSWANSIRLTAKSANINRNQITNLTIQTGVATTLATTVLGGFAKKSLAAAGPIGFFVINAFMFAKSMYSAFQNYRSALRLKHKGFGDTLAYNTYMQRTKDHLKAAGWHALATTAIALVVTFAPYVSVGVSLVAAGVQAGVKIYDSVRGGWPAVKRFGQWLRKKVGMNTDNDTVTAAPTQQPQPTHVISAVAIDTSDCVKQHMTCESHIDDVRAWKESRSKLQSDAGLRAYDQRFHYRDDQLKVIEDTYRAKHEKAVQVMRDRLLAILHHAIDEYQTKVDSPTLFINTAQMSRKLGLSKELARLLAAAKDGRPLPLARVHQAVDTFNGGWFKRGALGSMRKRVGGMQSIVEAVEYFAAYSSSNGNVSDSERQKMRYQYSNAYSITGQRTSHVNEQAYKARSSHTSVDPGVRTTPVPH